MTIELSGWRITAIRQSLGIFSSKKDKRTLLCELTVHNELDIFDLHNPLAVLTTIHASVTTQLAEKRAEISAILESSSRSDWIERRSKLKHMQQKENYNG
jgi:hypothetical protein